MSWLRASFTTSLLSHSPCQPWLHFPPFWLLARHLFLCSRPHLALHNSISLTLHLYPCPGIWCGPHPAGRSQTQRTVPVTKFFPGTHSTGTNTPPRETHLQQEAMIFTLQRHFCGWGGGEERGTRDSSDVSSRVWKALWVVSHEWKLLTLLWEYDAINETFTHLPKCVHSHLITSTYNPKWSRTLWCPTMNCTERCFMCLLIWCNMKHIAPR